MRLHLPICLLSAVLACYVSSSPAQARKWTDPDQGAVALGGDVCALYATDVCQEATPNDLAYSITITKGNEEQDIIAIDQTNTNGEVALKVGVAENCADEITASLTGASVLRWQATSTSKLTVQTNNGKALYQVFPIRLFRWGLVTLRVLLPSLWMEEALVVRSWLVVVMLQAMVALQEVPS